MIKQQYNMSCLVKFRVAIWILIVTVLFESVQSQCALCCSDGWTRFRGSCYLFNDNIKLDWMKSSHNCALHNSTLVTIESKEEDTFLRDFLNRLFRGDTKAGVFFWIGGSDTVTEGLWTWYTDDSNLTYTNWYPGQPDDGGHNEDCLDLVGGYGFLWNDRPCYNKAFPLCEKRMSEDTEIIG